MYVPLRSAPFHTCLKRREERTTFMNMQNAILEGNHKLNTVQRQLSPNRRQLTTGKQTVIGMHRLVNYWESANVPKAAQILQPDDLGSYLSSRFYSVV